MSKYIFFVRHAQTDHNAHDLLYTEDVDINKTGINEATITGQYLKQYGPYDIIISSPMKRTISTAQIIKQQVGYSGNIIINDNLKERDISKVIGLTMTMNEAHKIGFTDSCDPNPNIESCVDMYNRYQTFINYVKRLQHKKIIVVFHHDTIGPIMQLMFRIYDKNIFIAPNNYGKKNCMIGIVKYTKMNPFTKMITTYEPYLISTFNNYHLSQYYKQ